MQRTLPGARAFDVWILRFRLCAAPHLDSTQYEQSPYPPTWIGGLLLNGGVLRALISVGGTYRAPCAIGLEGNPEGKEGG